MQWDPKHCNTPSNEGRVTCQAGDGAGGLLDTAPVYYEDWPTFDCVNPPKAPDPMAAYSSSCKHFPSVANALRQLGQVSSFAFTPR